MLFTTNCVSFFGNIHSEKIFQVTLLFKYWVDVFGDKKKFNTWLETDNLALGRIKPKELSSKRLEEFSAPSFYTITMRQIYFRNEAPFNASAFRYRAG